MEFECHLCVHVARLRTGYHVQDGMGGIFSEVKIKVIIVRARWGKMNFYIPFEISCAFFCCRLLKFPFCFFRRVFHFCDYYFLCEHMPRLP